MVTILVIESDLAYANQIKKKISACQTLSLKLDCLSASSLKEALQLLQKKEIHLIITNLFLSDSQGTEIISQLGEILHPIPILLCGEKINEVLAETAIHLGAQDFFNLKKTTPLMLARLIRYAIERQSLMDTLRALTFTDELTEIYNRRGFITLVQQQIEMALRTNRGFCFYLIDVDYFKQINDTYGHQIGDQALKEIARLLKQSFRGYDIVGRIGGDEFAALAVDLPASMIETIKKKVKSYISDHKENHYSLSVSVGAAYFDPKQALSFEELFRQADEQLYLEKQARLLT